MKYKCISLDSPDEWKEALKGIRHSFAHTWENCYAMHLTTNYKTFLFSYEEESARVICPFAERTYGKYTDIVTPFGFSGFTGNGDVKNLSSVWNEFMKSKNYISGYISINPAFQNDTYFDPKDAYQTTSLYYLDLTKSLTELYENLDANRKKEIKNFRTIESSFTYDRKIITEFFIKNYHDFLKRVNASPANYFKTETLEYICNLENVFMVGTGSENKIEAVYIFPHTNYMGDCMFNISLPGGRRYTSVLFWRGMKFFRSKKIPLMNIGGGVKKDDNTALSKARFGGFNLPFMSLRQIYNPDIYKKLCIEKGIDAVITNGYFPAYRQI